MTSAAIALRSAFPERYMGEEFLAPECIDDRDHTVVATNMKGCLAGQCRA